MKIIKIVSGSLLLFSTLLLTTTNSFAENSTANQDGNIKFTAGTEITGIRDPENPEIEVDPGPSPSTQGNLRMDFVPQLNFSTNKISDKDEVYPVNAQLFLDNTKPRGNFVQVSDYRGASLGWQLQIRQENQFTNENTKNSVLNGTVISFDKSWTNSTTDLKDSPVVSKEIIQLNNIGETYNLATAEMGKGYGTWSISFGASSENKNGQNETLTPKVTKEDKPLLDSNFNNQQVYENSAIKVSIPGKTQKDPVQYSTVITWILAELP